MNTIHSEKVLKRIKNFQQTKIQKKLKTKHELNKIYRKILILFLMLLCFSFFKTAVAATTANETIPV